jgi:uncharacterized membrane protein
MDLLDHLHPAVVHFPIALLLLGSLLAIIYLYHWIKLDLRLTIWILLGLGWLGGAVAVLSGLLAQSGLPPDAPYWSELNWHIGTGLAQFVIYGILLYQGWMYSKPKARKARAARGIAADNLLDDPRARTWVTIVLTLGMLSVIATGWYGGLLVYEWGINVTGS